jgi:hypothetical protein
MGKKDSGSPLMISRSAAVAISTASFNEIMTSGAKGTAS